MMFKVTVNGSNSAQPASDKIIRNFLVVASLNNMITEVQKIMRTMKLTIDFSRRDTVSLS